MEQLNEPLLTAPTPGNCLLSPQLTSQLLKDEYGIINDSPSEELRFIVGKCHPIVMVPGIYSTKLQVRLNCKGLYEDDPNIYSEMRFYCGETICKNVEIDYEEHDLFISGVGSQFQILKGDTNKYSACLGYFMTFFNTEDVCAPDDNLGYVCNYSPHIRIGYYGSTKLTKEKGQCGLEPIQNLIMTGLGSYFDNLFNTGSTRGYKNMIDKLKDLGYKPGFSMAGVPNDYRRFLSTNKFTTDALRYEIENLYANTGKEVVLVGHSFGTLTILSNLLKQENKDLIPKIKKFIAIAPPFAGSNDLIDIFFHGLKMMKRSISQLSIETEFDNFGKEIMCHTSPTVFELRPLPIVGKLFKDENYYDFAEAIRERINLEKKCGHKECTSEEIESGSVLFDSIFKGYFPSLTESVCKFDSSIVDSEKFFGRKCLAEFYPIGDCPTIITKTDNFYPTFDDLDSYCGKKTDEFYYQDDCDNSEKKCLDEVYYTKGPYPFDPNNEKAEYFIDYWNIHFSEKFHEEKTMNSYTPKDRFFDETRRQIDYYNQISLTKDLPIPPIDTDIIYGNFNPTVVAYIFNDKNFTENSKNYRKGGDGTVPNWSSLLTGLKWIYDKKKNGLKQKIKLVEFCSRLSTNSEYEHQPTKDQDFVALSCQCLNSNNEYQSTEDCGHAPMLGDTNVINYVLNVLNDPMEEGKATEGKKNAIKNYDKNVDYQSKCDQNLITLLVSESP